MSVFVDFVCKDVQNVLIFTFACNMASFIFIEGLVENESLHHMSYF
jgi:hypothetical protein